MLSKLDMRILGFLRLNLTTLLLTFSERKPYVRTIRIYQRLRYFLLYIITCILVHDPKFRQIV